MVQPSTRRLTTEDRMMILEDQVIVGGEVGPSGNLLLTTNGGAVLDAGHVVGPSGTSGTDPAVTFTFATASTVWTCVHNLGKKVVDVSLADPAGNEIIGDIMYIDSSKLTVTWYFATAGTALIQP
jgi:hypothetical protein